MKNYFKIGLISIIIILLILLTSLSLSWTPPSDGDFRDYFALYNVTNITSEYIFQNGSQVLDTNSIVNYSGFANYSSYSNETTFWASVSSFVGRWFYDDSDILSFNETLLNNTIDTKVNSTNESMKSYVDTQDTNFNDSMKSYTDDTFIVKTSESDLNVNSSDYWDDIDTYNSSELETDSSGNLAILDSFINGLIDNRVVQSFVKALGFYDDTEVYNKTETDDKYVFQSNEGNLNVNSSNYWDNLNTESDLTPSNFITAGDYIGWIADTLNVNSSGILGSANDLDSSGDVADDSHNHGNATLTSLDWDKLQIYPSACPADTYLTQLGDSVTCTGISDIYLLNTGDNGTGNYYFENNISVDGDTTLKNTTIASNIVGVSSEGTQLYLASRSEDIDWTDPDNPIIKDMSPNTNNDGNYSGLNLSHGTVNGGVTIEDGAMVFDGVNGRVEIPHNDKLNINQNSISFWIKPITNGQNNNGRILEKTSSYRIYMVNGGIRINYFGLTDSEITSSSQTLNDWKNYIIIYDGETQKIYVNGVLDVTETTSGTITTNTNNLYIGDRAAGSTSFNGSIDDVQIYDRALTESEIQAQYELGRGKYALEKPIAQYSGRDYKGTASSPTTIYDTNFLSSKDEYMNAMNFDGVDDYVALSDPIITNITSVSISAFIKANNVSSVSSIGGQITNQYDTTMTRRGAYLFGINGDRNFQTRYYPSTSNSLNTAVISSTTAELGEWYHVTYTNNDGIGKLYVNGVLEATTPNMDSMWTNEIQRINRAKFGAVDGVNDGSTYSYLDGSIAQPLIYDRALSQDEITALYNRQKVYFTDNNPAGRLGDYAIKGDLTLNGNLTVNEETGVTDNSSYWLCTSSNCSTTCQALFEQGIMVGCS